MPHASFPSTPPPRAVRQCRGQRPATAGWGMVDGLSAIEPGTLLVAPERAGERASHVLCVFDQDPHEPGAVYALVVNVPTDTPAQPLAFGLFDCAGATRWWGGPTTEPFVLVRHASPRDWDPRPTGDPRPYVTDATALTSPAATTHLDRRSRTSASFRARSGFHATTRRCTRAKARVSEPRTISLRRCSRDACESHSRYSTGGWTTGPDAGRRLLQRLGRGMAGHRQFRWPLLSERRGANRPSSRTLGATHTRAMAARTRPAAASQAVRPHP